MITLLTILVVTMVAVVLLALVAIVCAIILTVMAAAGCSYSIYLVGGLTEWALAHTMNKTIEKIRNEEERA